MFATEVQVQWICIKVGKFCRKTFQEFCIKGGNLVQTFPKKMSHGKKQNASHEDFFCYNSFVNLH
jgi:hypothetical protein